MQYFFSSNISGNKILLSKEESRHCALVLRYKEGDLVNVIDGKGGLYTAEITQLKNIVELEIIDKVQQKKGGFYIHIVIAPTKSNQRLEWFIEKAVEIGVDEISFMSCQNSERKRINLNRIKKVMLAAMKQSVKTYEPKINDVEKFSDIITKVVQENKYIGHLGNHSGEFLKDLVVANETYCLLIGPEGDFSNSELDTAVKNKFIPVLLGQNRLRTETAGIVGCAILNGINDNE